MIDSNEEALKLIVKAIKISGFKMVKIFASAQMLQLMSYIKKVNIQL